MKARAAIAHTIPVAEIEATIQDVTRAVTDVMTEAVILTVAVVILVITGPIGPGTHIAQTATGTIHAVIAIVATI
jgi:uncharacterized membrane protein YczE